jgi:hypothetical protein
MIVRTDCRNMSFMNLQAKVKRLKSRELTRSLPISGQSSKVMQNFFE